jgi:aldehyde dehydrogenase (NAD+)
LGRVLSGRQRLGLTDHVALDVAQHDRMAVLRGDLSEALAIANNVAYGLSASVFTNDLRKAVRFVEQAEAGMLKVNQWTSGAAVQAPFGGFKHSGSGMFREMGKGAIEFYTQIKTVYLDGQ